MKKIVWFSRHEMSKEQKDDLHRIYGEYELMQINKTINSAFEIADDIKDADVIAIVAPINLQQQFLKIAGERPVITATSERIIVKNEDGSEDKVVFQFKNWIQIKKIEVVTEIL